MNLANIDGAMSRFVMGNFASFDSALSWISNQSEESLFWREQFLIDSTATVKSFQLGNN
jgi:hypothetical protein